MRLPTSLKCLLRLGMIGSCCWNVAWRLHPPGNMRLTLRKRLELGAPLHRSGAICSPVLEFRDESLTDATKSIIAKPEASASRGALTASRLPRHTCVCVCLCVCVRKLRIYIHMHVYIHIYIYTSLFLYFMKVCVHVSLLRRQHNDNRIAALPFRQRHSSRLCNGPGTDTKNPEPRALLRAYAWHIAEFDGGLNPQRV